MWFTEGDRSRIDRASAERLYHYCFVVAVVALVGFVVVVRVVVVCFLFLLFVCCFCFYGGFREYYY